MPTLRRFPGLGLLLIAFATGCGDEADPTAPDDVVAEVSPTIRTVVNVRWTTQKASIGYIEYGPTADMEFNTPLEAAPTEQHAMPLLGLTADTEYLYRVVTWDGGNAGASEVKRITTGPLPVGMPRLTLTGAGHDQFTIVPILGTNRAVTIINSEGEIVWYHRDERELDFYRARLSVDGKSLVYNAGSVSGDPADNSELVRVALDGSGSSSIPVPLLAHDFVEHPDGTLGAMVVEYRDSETMESCGPPASDTCIRGDKIVEIIPSGEQTTVWNAWDCFDPAVHPSDDLAHGWTFGNALDYDPNENAYYLGMRNFSSITKINRDTRACEWVLGRSASTFDFAAGSGRFLHQHQFHIRGDHIVVMDNEGEVGNVSRVLEYQLDFAANVATQVWSFTADPTVYTFVLGEPTRFDDGSTFINWSSAGQMELVNAEGVSIWKLNSGAGAAFGFNTLAKSLYPSGAPMP